MVQDAAAAASGCTWYIRHVDLFQPLSDRDVDALARAMSTRRYAAGQLIVGPDAQPEWVYLTRAGTVRMFHREPGGREITVDRLNAGHLFGVTRLLGRPSSFLLAQAETETVICAVEGGRFLSVVARWPQALLALALRLGLRVHESEHAVRQLSATGARARLAAALHALAARQGSETQPGGGVRLRGVPRHSELAAQIGASRETVTRMLARLERDGYIRRFGRQIVVPDPSRLADDFDLG